MRLPTLVALADALSVSIDRLVGRSAALTSCLEHRALLYGSDEEFVETAVPFVNDGIAASESVLVVTTRDRARRLRRALSSGGQDVHYEDSAKWYRSPSAALNGFSAFVTENVEAGASWVRIVGEPIWAGRSAPDVAAWTRYESLLNLAFASLPTTVVCPYDTRSVPARVLAGARATHPMVVDANDVSESSSYRRPEEFLVEPTNA